VPQVPPAVQPRPELQVSPAQHASPEAPHVAQVPLWQAKLLPVHVAPAQQTSPAAPQLAHVPLLHARPAPVHVSPAQHV
jgi:hypothetical protein